MSYFPRYYRQAAGALLVYDITCRDSFENLKEWLEEAERYRDREMEIVLVGNKSDLRPLRSIEYEERRLFAGTFFNNKVIMHETKVSLKPLKR